MALNVPNSLAAWTGALQSLLPPGRAFTREPGSVLAKLLEACAAMFKGRQDTLDALAVEADPRLALTMLPEWESLLGLPDACYTPLKQLLVPGVYDLAEVDLLSFTRAGEAGYFNEQGVWTTAPAGAPRFDHDLSQVVGEPESTNLALYSGDFADAVWVISSAAKASNTDVGLDGLLSADTLSVLPNSSGGVFQYFDVTPGRTMTWSIHAKRSAATSVAYRIYDQTNLANIAIGSYYNEINAESLTRLFWSFVVPPGCTTLRAYAVADTANGQAHGAVVDGAQMEVGYLTSYIKTLGAAVYRAATYVLRGLLVEAAATNSLVRSNDFAHASWVALTAKIVAANVARGLDGTMSASTLTDNSAVAYCGMSQTYAIVANDGLPRCFSILLAKTYGATSATVGLSLVLGGGFAGVFETSRINTDSGAIQGPTTGVIDLGNFWLFFSTIKDTVGNGSTTCTVNFYPALSAHGVLNLDTVTATGTCTIGESQFEIGLVPSTRIRTLAAAVTRAADVAYINVERGLVQRRADAFQRLTEQGGQSRQYFIDLAATLGEPGCTITEFRPMNCNDDCNDALISAADKFSWRVNIPHSNAGARPMNCNDDCNDALDLGGELAIACPIRDRAPAHTNVFFAYAT